MMANVGQRQENRREANRQSARRYYHKKRQVIEELRAEADALEERLSADRPFLRYDYPAKKNTENAAEQDTIEALQRENADLRKCLDQLLSWEQHLKELVHDKRASASPLALDQAPRETRQPHIGLKKPLTVTECHTLVREVYSEIATFNASGRDGWISTGASVFGWTDLRRVDNGVLKFSLSKLNEFQSAEVVSAAAWNILTTPGGYEKIISQNFGMRSEIVQVVDHSNVVIWQEYQVHSNTGGVAAVTVVRALVLLTLFATDEGYMLLLYGLDPELATYPSDDYLVPLEDSNTIVKYEWQPMFSWGSYNRVEGAPNQCFSSLVGTMPVEGANFVNWAVEVLLVVLRFESILLGPSWTLPPSE